MPLKISNRASDSEKHELDINNMLLSNGKLYTTSDDGKIKCWSLDLKSESEVSAHPCSVYCITEGDNCIYSCSNDGTIKTWQIGTLKEIKTIHNDPETEFWAVKFAHGCLFSGDSNGNLRVYKNNKLYGAFNIAEPVKDMIVVDTTLITSNLLDVVVTKILTEAEKIHYEAVKVFQGRAPLTLVGKKICYSNRDGKGIIMHEFDHDTGYARIGENKEAHEMVINALASAAWDSNEYLFSGGWDKTLKKWKLDKNGVTLEDQLNLDFVITSIVAGNKNELFVGGENGILIKVDQ